MLFQGSFLFFIGKSGFWNAKHSLFKAFEKGIKPEQYCQLLVMHNGVRRGDIS